MRVVVPKIVQGISNIVPTIQLAVGFFSKRNVIVWFSHIALGVVLVGGWGICTHIRGGEVALGWCGRHRRGETQHASMPTGVKYPARGNSPLWYNHMCISHSVPYSTHFGSVWPSVCYITQLSVCSSSTAMAESMDSTSKHFNRDTKFNNLNCICF